MSALVAGDAAEVQEAVREGGPLVPVAGGTHTATLPAPDGPARALDLSGLTGIVDYDPAELTFTARAGTSLTELETMLAANGQHLPFDPPRLGAAGTIGGAVAAGVTGPNGFAAGIRDFVIGVRFVDGSGRLAAGGGKVVKNAAGFDLPKLMVGSLGRLGVIVELSLKVFPTPCGERYGPLPDHRPAGGPRGDRRTGPRPGPGQRPRPRRRRRRQRPHRRQRGADRGAGRASRADARTARRVSLPGRRPSGSEARRFAWVGPDARLVVVPIAPRRLPALDAELERRGIDRRYGLAANVAWIAWPAARPLGELSDMLAAHGAERRRPDRPAAPRTAARRRPAAAPSPAVSPAPSTRPASSPRERAR